jgi:SEC-C motif domain protein
MRSRYSAFARGDDAYLLRTTHPDHADLEAGADAMRRSLQEGLRSCRYGGLRVLDQRPAGEDGLAEVLFFAKVMVLRGDGSFVERSYFAHDGVGWRYLSGDSVYASALRGRVEGLTIPAFEAALGQRR